MPSVEGSFLAPEAETKLMAQVAAWRNELVNLTRRSRLLYFRHQKVGSLEFAAPDASTLTAVLDGGGEFFFEAELDDSGDGSAGPGSDSAVGSPSEARRVVDGGPGQPTRSRSSERTILVSRKNPTEMGRSLSSLARVSRQTFLDKGIWSLHLAVGMLRWVEPADGSAVDSPVLLIPVSLERDSPHAPFRMVRAEADASLNPALGIKMAADFGVEIPAMEDIDDTDPAAILRLVREAVAARDGWAVSDRRVLSLFSFHKEVMYRDLVDNEERVVSSRLVQAVGLGPDFPHPEDFSFEPVGDDSLDEVAPPEHLVNILDADSSQRRCVAAAGDGRSFVMDGPPGTGKSQTITNMIAETLRAGRSVLFVSEKAAALDVVYDRLARAGLDPFTLRMHSQNATRRAVAEELGRALRERPQPASPAMKPERVEVLRRARMDLSEYAQAMNEVRLPLGMSLHDAIGRASALSGAPSPPPAPVDPESFSLQSLVNLLGVAGRLARSWDPVELGEGFYWRQINPTLRAADVEVAGRVAEAALRALRDYRGAVESACDLFHLPAVASQADAERVAEIVEVIESRPGRVPLVALTTGDWVALRDTLGAAAEATWRFKRIESWSGDGAGPGWRNIDLDTAEGWERATDGLAKLDPPLAVPDDFNAERLFEAKGYLNESARLLDDIAAQALEVARIFGTGDTDPSLGRAEELVELARLAWSEHRPDAAWLDRRAQKAVRKAVEVLEPLVGEWNAQRRELGDRFTDSVLSSQELDAVAARFERVHHGLRKLSGQYRSDKAFVAQLTVTGSVDADTLGKLGAAVSWRNCHARLQATAAVHGPVLAGYYQAERTDFDAVRSALDVAKKALDLAGSYTDGLVRVIGDGQDPDPVLSELAERLAQNVAAWRRLVANQNFPLPELPATVSAAQLAKWSSRAAEAVGVARDALIDVGERNATPVTFAQASLVAANVKAYWEVSGQIDGLSKSAADILGEMWSGPETDWEEVERALSWSDRLREAFGGALPEPAARRALTAPGNAREIGDSLEAWNKARGALRLYFSGSRWEEVSDDIDTSFDQASDFLASLCDTSGQIHTWNSFSAAVDELKESGLSALVEWMTTTSVDRSDVESVVELSLLQGWIAQVVASDRQRLGELRAQDRDALVEEFAALDRQLVETSAALVIAACTALRPATLAGAAGIIAREAEKQKRHMPIRDLFSKTGGLVQRLKPCFMMSPLSVSQYLPPDMVFDLVIFDEASQVRPADAVNCMYRGRQLVVAGDKKQLPPTSFFEAVNDSDDDYQEDQLDDFESILELCKASACIESLPLRWHYRSAHESLITYSNYRFYDGELLTFPGAVHDAPDLGVKLFQVGGVYQRGGSRTNPIEARFVVDRVRHHRRENPGLSIGVVAFSAAQEDCILAEVDRQADLHPELEGLRSDDRLNGFFVKNLENVQGDERDIIIFSVGYGPDENGKFQLNLGPLTRAGGWRRLNVAITRAKRLVEVVASIGPEDISPASESPGVRHLRGYLDFAKRGVPALAIDLSDSLGDAESPFEEEVLKTLRSWGYDAVPQVGVAGYRIDIGVRHPAKPGVYALGVECDGAMYHSSKVARDRDRLRQSVLENLGWRLLRIWGPAWYYDRKGQESRLRAAIEDAFEGPSQSAQPATGQGPRVVIVEHDFDDLPSWATPYQPAPQMAYGVGAFELHESGARPVIRRVIEHVVSYEQPVAYDTVLRFVLDQWGKLRSGARIRSNFDQAIQELAGSVVYFERGFLAAPACVVGKVRVPTRPDHVRPVKAVPRAELRLAVENLVREAEVIPLGELATATARLFKWQRTGPDIAAAVEAAAAELIAAGRMADDGVGRLRII